MQAEHSVQGVTLGCRTALGPDSSSLVGDLPVPFAVATPPTDLQQGLRLRVRIQNALAAFGLGKKEKRVCSVTNAAQPRAGGDVSSLLEGPAAYRCHRKWGEGSGSLTVVSLPWHAIAAR